MHLSDLSLALLAKHVRIIAKRLATPIMAGLAFAHPTLAACGWFGMARRTGI
jgi:hypothetical protein